MIRYSAQAMLPLVLGAAVLYALASIGGFAALRDRRWVRAVAWSAAAAWAIHTAAVVGAALAAAGWSLWTTAPGAILLVTWLVASSYLVGDELLRDAAKTPGGPRAGPAAGPSGGLELFVFPAVSLGLGLDLLVRWTAASPDLGGYSSVLLEPWVPVHALLGASGWGLFSLAWVAGMMYRTQDRSLRRLSLGPLSRLLPSLEALDRASLRLVAAGLLFLVAGLVPGIFRAAGLWGRLWFAEPKVVSTLLAVFAYAFYLGARTRLGWTAKRAAWLLTVGFILTAVNLLVASPFLSHLHQWL